MEFLLEYVVNCPYCGERIEALVDHQEAGDQYTEDCQVCCQPIVFKVASDLAGQLRITVQTENDAC